MITIKIEKAKMQWVSTYLHMLGKLVKKNLKTSLTNFDRKSAYESIQNLIENAKYCLN